MSEEKISISFVGRERYTVLACGKYFENHEKVVREAEKFFVSSDSKVLDFKPDEFPILIFKIEKNEWNTSSNFYVLSDAKSPEPPKTFDGFNVVKSWYFRTSEDLLNSKDFYRIHSETEKREYLRKILNKHTFQKMKKTKDFGKKTKDFVKKSKDQTNDKRTRKFLFFLFN